jgi:CheY-like chemotaxis protein
MKQKLKCILVIDDDEPTNFFTRMILEEMECAEHVQTVQSGQEALEYLGKSESDGNDESLYPSPDLIFLDINMPAMNGWEFLEEYKQISVKHRIIMVMLTTSLFPEDKSRAESIPEISGFENKPITDEKVKAVVEKYFSKVPVT